MCAAMLFCATLLPGASAAAGQDADAARAGDRPNAPARSDKADAPRCVHGCLRWGKFCNVDPRGVYKCQRRCEKFGEICE